MKKQLTALLIASAFFVCGVSAASAQTSTPSVVGTWAISGATSIKVYLNQATTPIEQILSLFVQISNIAMTGEEFTFGTATDGTGSFTDTLLGINGNYPGTYTISNRGAFTIDIDTWIDEVQSELIQAVQDLDANGTITVTRKILTGQVVSNTKIQGTLDVEFMVSLPDLIIPTTVIHGAFNVPVSILASLSGKPMAAATKLEASVGSADSAKSAAAFIFQKLILPALGFAGK